MQWNTRPARREGFAVVAKLQAPKILLNPPFPKEEVFRVGRSGPLGGTNNRLNPFLQKLRNPRQTR